MTAGALRVLIVDDHELIAQGVAMALEGEGMKAAVSTGPTTQDVLAAAERLRPDVVLLDLQINGQIGSGLHLVKPLASLGAAVVVLTGVTDEAALAECLEQGAYGLARKSEPFEQLVNKVVAAAHGDTVTPAHERFALIDTLRLRRRQQRERFEPFRRLTTREAEVLDQLMHGVQAEAIARDFFVSVATVRSQIRSILRKLDVNSQLAAVALATEAEWQLETSALAN